MDHEHDAEQREPVVPDPAEIVADAKAKLHESHDDELEFRLKSIEMQAQKGQGHYREAMPKPDDARSKGMTGEQGKSLGVGLSIAYAILGVPLVMFGIGYLIDNAAHTAKLFQSSLGLLGCVIAVGYAMYAGNKAGKSR